MSISYTHVSLILFFSNYLVLIYLYIYTLKRLKLQENIKIRGRSYEQNIKNEYLDKIQDGYFEFIKQQSNLPILIIDTNNIDFVHNKKDYNNIVSIVTKE